MKLRIKLLKPLSDAIGKNEIKIEFKGKTLDNLLKVMIEKYPKLRNEFYTKNDKISDLICIFINDKPILALNGFDTKLKNNDEILFFIPVSGG